MTFDGTFEQGWRANEADLADKHYDGDKWIGIYHLLRRAWEAGGMVTE